MCGRFTLRASAKDIADLFAVEVQLELLPRYNIAPSQDVLAIRADPEQSVGGVRRHAVNLRWGLVPSWADDPSIGNSLINARAETLATKPAFRKAFAQRRCLIASDGFYEWKKLSTGKGKTAKQPYYITRTDGRAFAFAGVYERWRRGELSIDSCTIVTTEANDVLRPLHHRMPVILLERDFDAWLNPCSPDLPALERLLCPLDPQLLQAVPVSPLVNRPANDTPECIESVVEEPAELPAAKSDRMRNLELF